MDTWADVDAAFEAVMNQRKKRQENLTIISTILIFSSTIWLIAPSIQPALQGKGGLIQALGLPLIVIIWALQVDEYVNGDAKETQELLVLQPSLGRLCFGLDYLP